VGYEIQHRGYRLYSPFSRVVFFLRDIKFNELSKESTFEDLDYLDDSSITPN